MKNVTQLKSDLALSGGSPCVSKPIGAFHGIQNEEKEAVGRFFDTQKPLSGFHGSARPSFYGGDEVQSFEKKWRKLFKCKHAISMNSATSCLIAAMGAIGISPGDEVIVPSYTMSATAIAPLFYGGIPVFVDVEDQYFCLDVEKVKAAINPKTKAIIAVNLWGHPAELKALRELANQHGIYLIEDNAQAILSEENGQYCGTVGHIGLFSMNIHKHIQSGEGGVCTTDDDDLAERLCLIRNHGENVIDWLNVQDLTNTIGFNFRQTEIGAVIAQVQMDKLDRYVQRCQSVSQKLTEGIKGLQGLYAPKTRTGCSHVYYMWSLRFKANEVGCTRTEFAEALRAEGVPIAEGYVPPLYRLPMFKKKIGIGREGFPFNLAPHVSYEDGLCPVTERLHEQEILQYQPMSWDPDEQQINQMIDAFHKVHAALCKS